MTNKRFFTAFGRQFQHSKQKFQVLGLYAPCLHGHSGLSGDRNSALKRHTQMKHLAMHYMAPVDKTEMIFRCFLMMNKNDFPRFHLDLEHGVTSTCFFLIWTLSPPLLPLLLASKGIETVSSQRRQQSRPTGVAYRRLIEGERARYQRHAGLNEDRDDPITCLAQGTDNDDWLFFFRHLTILWLVGFANGVTE